MGPRNVEAVKLKAALQKRLLGIFEVNLEAEPTAKKKFLDHLDQILLFVHKWYNDSETVQSDKQIFSVLQHYKLLHVIT